MQALQAAMAALCFSVGTSALCEFPLPLGTEPNAIFQQRGADICGVCGFAMAAVYAKGMRTHTPALHDEIQNKVYWRKWIAEGQEGASEVSLSYS